MSRNYHHIKEHEKEILSLKEQRFTKREIGEKQVNTYVSTTTNESKSKQN